MKRITILAGHYGSGKSEISVNLALKHNVDTIVDLDIINPYFRSRALHELFDEHGIHLVESTIKGMLNSDLPYVSGESAVPLVNEDITAIYDLGGTENGGRVMIQFVDKIKNMDDIDLLYVVNLYRPETATKEKIIKELKALETESQLHVTGLINNTNLMQHTTEEDLKRGEEVLLEVGEELGIPITHTVIEESHQFNSTFQGETIILSRLVAQKWL